MSICTQLSGGVSRLGDALLDFVYPPHCPVCVAWLPPDGRQVICMACADALAQDAGPRCRRCSAPVDSACHGAACTNCDHWQATEFSRALVLADFRDVAHDAIHHLKFSGIKQIGCFLGGCIATYKPFEQHLSSLDVLIPVPLHPARQRQRGFNQASEIARGLGSVLGVPIDERTLRRVRSTRQQARLDAATRLDNVMGAFVAGRPLRAQRVGLVDDVMTTGATMSACATALRTVCSGEILAITVASPFRRQQDRLR